MVFNVICFRSDELLNYEIGDVEADDTVLTGADEDELLLSDDGNVLNWRAFAVVLRTRY